MMAYNFLQSVRCWRTPPSRFTENCVVGIEPRLDNIQRASRTH
jgi:fumarate hydratase class II